MAVGNTLEIVVERQEDLELLQALIFYGKV